MDPLVRVPAASRRRAIALLLVVASATTAALAGAVGYAAVRTQGQIPRSGSDAGPAHRKPVIFDAGPGLLDGRTRDQTLDRIDELGADMVRVVIPWRQVAPTHPPLFFDPANPASPGYEFSAYDAIIRGIKARGMRLLLTPSSPFPEWASASGTSSLADPKPEEFGRFVHALAVRYSGWFSPTPGHPLPGADLWSIWNEPNLGIYLLPQFRNGVPYSPLLYRRLYLAAEAAISSVSPRAAVLIGETSPTGSSAWIDPLRFARDALCLRAALASAPECGRRIETAGWAVHPYASDDAVAPFEVSRRRAYLNFGSLSRLVRLLNRAATAGAIRPNLPLYLTEYGQLSVPNPFVGVPLRQQAEYNGLAERMVYSHPRIASFAQYLMRDEIPAHQVSVTNYGFQSGLRFFGGGEKPAFAAFRTPLAVLRQGERVRLWGLVRPVRSRTKVTIRIRDRRGRPRRLARLRTNAAGFFTRRTGFAPGRRWQVVWTDPSGQVLPGPWTRAYRVDFKAWRSGSAPRTSG
jgi:hypothetical protein